jgi:hypothetical protein
MTNREFRRHLTEKRLEAIRAEVLADDATPLADKPSTADRADYPSKKPPATERQLRASLTKA